jgi:hypothetical protein
MEMTLTEDQIACKECQYVNRRNSLKCLKCSESLGAVNVNIIDIDSEKEALNLRYENSRNSSKAFDKLCEFENHVKENGKAVINTDIKLLHLILQKGMYQNYHILVEENVKEIAKDFDNRKRSKVEGYLFGAELARKLVYAALSTDGNGLRGYGKVSITLLNEAIERRASLLEENSYDFAMTNDRIINDEIPKGFRANWIDKHKLAVAKLFEKITINTYESEFNDIILFTDGNRGNENFIEIYIFDPVFIQAFKEVRVPDEAINEFLRLGRKVYQNITLEKVKHILGTRFIQA